MVNRLSRWAPILLILIIPLLLFWQLLFSGRVLYWGTPLLQFYPWRSLAVEMYRQGEIPLWNPYLGMGAPLAANMQSAVFYPLNLIFLLLPTERAMGYSVIIHVALAGFFTYLYGRSLGLSGFGSLVAALAYMLSGPLIARAGFLSLTSTAPWLPLLFALALSLRDTVQRHESTSLRGPFLAGLRWSSLAGLVLALLLLAGHPQLAYYSLWAFSLYLILLAMQGARGAALPWRHLLRFGLLAAGALLLGLALAAIQLLPTLELALLSVRSQGAEGAGAMVYSLWPLQLMGVVAPDLLGNPTYGNYWGPGNYWEASAYLGLLPLLLVPLGVLRGRSPSRLFLAGMALLSLLLALGRYLPVYPLLFHYLPGLDLFQAPARFLYLYAFAMAALAGIGADALRAEVGKNWWQTLSAYVLAGGLGIFLGVATLRVGLGNIAVRTTFLDAFARLGPLLMGVGLLFLLARRLPLWGAQGLLVVFLSLDLFLFAYPLNPTAEAGLYSSSTGTADFLRRNLSLARVYTPEASFLGKFFTYFRFDTFGFMETEHLLRVRDTLLPNLASLDRLQEVYNYDPLALERLRTFLRALDSSGLKPGLLSMMSVRYVLTDTLPSASPLPLEWEGDTRIYGNVDFLPRAYLVHRALPAADASDALKRVLEPTFNPRLEVVLEGQVGPELLSDRGWDLQSRVTILDYAAHRVRLSTASSQAGFLVLTDSFYPGWRVWIDGEEGRILRANFLFRAVSLPPGEHEVVFRYQPLSFRIGALVSGLSFLLILFGVALPFKTRMGPA